MELDEFKKIMIEKSKKLNIYLNDEQVKMFYIYMNLLIEWNQKLNLTAITEPNEIILKHFIDSLTICKYIDLDSENEREQSISFIDVGTGAGFPGIPLKIVMPSLEVTLLDSLNKRILFLDDVILKLNLKKIIALHGRAEDFGKDKKYREKFDYTTSRAVANLSVLSEYLLPLTKIGGKCICMKGANLDDELNSSKRAISILGGKIEKINNFSLVDTDMERNIVLIRKEKLTPNKYPRKAGIPAKDPI